VYFFIFLNYFGKNFILQLTVLREVIAECSRHLRGYFHLFGYQNILIMLNSLQFLTRLPGQLFILASSLTYIIFMIVKSCLTITYLIYEIRLALIASRASAYFLQKCTVNFGFAPT